MQREYSASDSASTVEMRPAVLAADRTTAPIAPVVDEELKSDFWMSTRQTQCGASLTERMASFLKAITAAQAEFAEKLTAITTAEMARARAVNITDAAAIYEPYWEQMQLAMRLCSTMASSSKEMTTAVGSLMPQMDRIGQVSRSRLRESAAWNVELNKNLSMFHTNVSKRQVKCYKALSIVMTPEYFDQSPARKAQSVRRAAPTVAKYVEEIDAANVWLSEYMKKRPTLKNRLEVLESKRLEVSRRALTTFAQQMQIMGQLMNESASEIIDNVSSIDDTACKKAFIADCRALPTPHLEAPSLFEYQLPVPISELGIRPVRDPNTVMIVANTIQEPSILSSVQRPVAPAAVESPAFGKRFSSFAQRMFNNNNNNQAVRGPKPPTSAPPARDDDDDNENSASEESAIEIAPFGNINAKDVIRPVVSAPIGAGVGGDIGRSA